MSDASYKILTVVSEAFSQNAYVLWRIGDNRAIVVDPGLDVAKLMDVVQHHHLYPAAILNTHGHYDHIAGNAPLKQVYPEVPLIIGRNESDLLTNPDANLSGKLGLPMTSPPADRLVDEGERLEIAGFSFLVREIPGHSPGSVVFIADQEAPPFVLAGDVLFAGSVGRADFPEATGRPSWEESARSSCPCPTKPASTRATARPRPSAPSGEATRSSAPTRAALSSESAAATACRTFVRASAVDRKSVGDRMNSPGLRRDGFPRCRPLRGRSVRPMTVQRNRALSAGAGRWHVSALPNHR